MPSVSKMIWAFSLAFGDMALAFFKGATNIGEQAHGVDLSVFFSGHLSPFVINLAKRHQHVDLFAECPYTRMATVG